MASLRVKVLLMTACVACASVAAVGFYARKVGVDALRHQFELARPADLLPWTGPLGAAFSRRTRWDDVEPVLAHAAKVTGKQLLILDSLHHPVLAVPNSLLTLDITLTSDGVLSWQTRRVNPQADSLTPGQMVMRVQRVAVGAVTRASIRATDGRSLGTLIEIPLAIAMERPGDAPGLETLRRSVLLGIWVALVGALLVAFILSARVVAPIERLTAEVRAVTRPPLRHIEPRIVPASGTGEVAELARAFNAMLADNSRSERLRAGMTGDIAHELRAPLTNIRCHIESLQDGLELPSDETLRSLHDEVLVLQRLINDLQDLNLAEQGRLRLDLEALDLTEEITSALHPFQSRAASSGAALRFESRANSPIVTADRIRLRQVVVNLLTNALTHTPAVGEVAIVVERADPTYAVVRVRDTGSGIPQHDLANIFERFYRVDPSRSRASGGAGLGLAIVRQLVCAQGGTVWAESTLGIGTTIAFTLPLARDHAQ